MAKYDDISLNTSSAIVGMVNREHFIHVGICLKLTNSRPRDTHARFKPYEYRANSSLVLTTESRPRDTHESTGEPESLWGRWIPNLLVIVLIEEDQLTLVQNRLFGAVNMIF